MESPAVELSLQVNMDGAPDAVGDEIHGRELWRKLGLLAIMIVDGAIFYSLESLSKHNFLPHTYTYLSWLLALLMLGLGLGISLIILSLASLEVGNRVATAKKAMVAVLALVVHVVVAIRVYAFFMPP